MPLHGIGEFENPVEFFRRTCLTESLKRLWVGAGQPLSIQGGEPVVQLQNSVGGGQRHSMLALYHLFSGIAPREFMEIDERCRRLPSHPFQSQSTSANRIQIPAPQHIPASPTRYKPSVAVSHATQTTAHSRRVARHVHSPGSRTRPAAPLATPPIAPPCYVVAASRGIWKSDHKGVTSTPIFNHPSVNTLGGVTSSARGPKLLWSGTCEQNKPAVDFIKSAAALAAPRQ